MKVYTIEDECPYCHIKTTIGCMETENLCILQCGKCQWVWKLFQGKAERMIRMKESGPDTYEEELLCPRCWRKLKPDYTTWSIRCDDPTCGYSKRIPGLSREQEALKAAYFKVRQEVFALTSENGEVPEALLDTYKTLKERYNTEVKKYDKKPSFTKEPAVSLPTD